MAVEMQVSCLSSVCQVTAHCTALPGRWKAGSLETDFLALPAGPPHSSLVPALNPLLAVQGLSEPEHSSRVDPRFLAGLLQI